MSTITVHVSGVATQINADDIYTLEQHSDGTLWVRYKRHSLAAPDTYIAASYVPIKIDELPGDTALESQLSGNGILMTLNVRPPGYQPA